MPNAFLTKVADVCNISHQQAEDLWEQAKKIAQDRGYDAQHPSFYAYVTGIFKNSLGRACEDALQQHEVLSPTRAGAVLALLAEADRPSRRDKKPGKTLKQPPVTTPEPEAEPVPEPSPVPEPAPAKADTKPADKAPAGPAQAQLARDLGELYHDLLLRWEGGSGTEQAADPGTVTEPADDAEAPAAMDWSDDNPYAQLPESVREVLQAGAVLHYGELDGLRAAAERAMHDWQITQPRLLDGMAAALRELPRLHREALTPLVQELVDQGLLPQTALTSLDPAQNPDPERWRKTFPTLLAANAAQAAQSLAARRVPSGLNPERTADTVANVVMETLVECLLYN